MKRILRIFLVLLIISVTANAFATYTTLQLGSSGTEVKQLQTALKELGFFTGEIDGKYGAVTRKAVLQFQTSRGLKADGKAGNLTLTALYSETSESQTGSETTLASSLLSFSRLSGLSSSTLRYGSSGTLVTKLQTALNRLGYSTGGIDGKFGLATLNAVALFQKNNGLTVDGLAGLSTQQLLYSLSSADTSDDSSSAETSTESTSSSTSDTSSSSFTGTLRSGSSGNAVLAAQRQLQLLGYYSGTLDGKYGSGTLSSVKSFQSANGLTADGLLGKVTWNLLFSENAVAFTASKTENTSSATASSSTTETNSSLQSGSSGSAVTKLQKALRALGWSITVDGKYGSGTTLAVKNFQELNGLTASGIADAATQQKLYSGSAVGPVTDSGSEESNVTHGTVVGSNGATIHLLHWYNDVKPNLSSNDTLVVYDPSTGISWNLKVLSRGRHCDCEPATAEDTEKMNQAFGGITTWTPKAVYVKLPSGIWSLASTHNTPHLSGNIKDNNFDGHLCVHFLRDMTECTANDPNYGVTNQNTIRKKWKELTGVTVN